MDTTTAYEQLLRDLSDVQRQFFTGWTSMLPGWQNSSNAFNPWQNFNNIIKFQQQAVSSSLEFQALVARLSVETQRQFWDNYFKLLR
jgi:hypothetical protein